MLNQENIYQLLQQEKWTELIDIFYRNKDMIKSDILLQQASETTIQIMVQKANSFHSENEFIENLAKLNLLNAGKFIKLTSEQNEVISIALGNGYRKNISLAYNYVKMYPNNEISKSIIEEYYKEFPKEINHTLESRIITTENRINDQGIDARKSMFNSYQETEFFIALKRVFDSYQVYPNVALSNIFDYELIKTKLNEIEINFFFKSSVDFVVFEPFKNYIPIYFFELDSVYHDSDEQRQKDRIKDKIFSLSNSKLYRIRKRDKSVGEVEFEQIIREIREVLK